jgi:hypothetical protein
MKVFKISRKPFSNNATILYENGSSDYLPHQKLREKLLKEGLKNPDKVLDYVWNFYEAEVRINNDHAQINSTH